jgi:Tfp pilus assembly protein PilF
VEKFPQSGAAHAQAGLLAARRGDRAGTRAAYEKALSLEPSLLEPLAALSALDVSEGKGSQARARVEAQLQKTPKSSAVLVVAARTWASTGDQAKAEEFLHRAVDADASNFDAYVLLAQLYMGQRKLDQALAEYDKLAARQPNSTGAKTMAALILQAQGKESEAQQRYEKIVDADPRAAVAANNLAWMLASRGEQLDRALQLAQAAKAELPENAAISDTLAFVYIKKQLGSLAVPLLRQSISKEPNNPAYHYHLGMALAQTGDKAGARQALEQALKLKPDFEGADEARILLRTLG